MGDGVASLYLALVALVANSGFTGSDTITAIGSGENIPDIRAGLPYGLVVEVTMTVILLKRSCGYTISGLDQPRTD